LPNTAAIPTIPWNFHIRVLRLFGTFVARCKVIR
jgi:hypothetical protein